MFTFFGLGIKTEAKDTKFSSKAYGTRENKFINILYNIYYTN